MHNPFYNYMHHRQQNTLYLQRLQILRREFYRYLDLCYVKICHICGKGYFVMFIYIWNLFAIL